MSDIDAWTHGYAQCRADMANQIEAQADRIAKLEAENAAMDEVTRGVGCACEELEVAGQRIAELEAALAQIAMEQSARTATQAADYFQHVARQALATS